jgi:hypothetical protein
LDSAAAPRSTETRTPEGASFASADSSGMRLSSGIRGVEAGRRQSRACCPFSEIGAPSLPLSDSVCALNQLSFEALEITIAIVAKLMPEFVGIILPANSHDGTIKLLERIELRDRHQTTAVINPLLNRIE